MRIVLAGGSGFIGHALLREFRRTGDEMVVLSRSSKPIEGARVAAWDGRTVGNWATELEGAAAVINLTGEPIAQKWTDDAKQRFWSSRVESTQAVGEAIQRCHQPPVCWVNASAIGYYGDTGDREVDETSPPANDFLGALCQEWESAQQESSTPNIYKSLVRVGFPLGREGGAFPPLWKLTKAFMGGAVGSGRNWVPWIHIDDLAAIFRWCIETKHEGPVNGVGPAPVTFNELMASMRQTARRPWVPNVPVAVAKFGELFGAPPMELATQSSRVGSTVLPHTRFQYRFPTLSSALADLTQ